MIPFPALTAMSKWCADVAPAVENHLWQSTVFAAVAAVLTLALRRNQARARYWIWMAASIKFLVPFALLVSVGGMMAKPRATAAVVAQPSVYLAMEEVSQPFVEVMVPVVQATAPTAASTLAALAPAIVASVWTIGFATVLCVWTMRWRRVAHAMRGAVPVREGREMDALRKLEQAGGVRAPIRLLLSPGAMEPGVFGVGGTNAVLAWPKGISERLDDAHLEAILAHEVAHVRRRDNLTAAGFIRWCGGWARVCLRSASARATRRCCSCAGGRRCMRKGS
jgi:beta-lactamase regulating signal transducer with metallopeptidase domain